MTAKRKHTRQPAKPSKPSELAKRPKPARSLKSANRTAATSRSQSRSRARPRARTRSTEAIALKPADLDALRQQLEARIADAMPARWNPEPDDVRRAVMKLVLTIVEFVRQLLERQAVRRMEAQTLTPEQIEAVGLALMKLEEAVRDLARQSGLDPSELNLDLGPLGRLL